MGREGWKQCSESLNFYFCTKKGQFFVFPKNSISNKLFNIMEFYQLGPFGIEIAFK
jgi:hypothetical protein